MMQREFQPVAMSKLLLPRDKVRYDRAQHVYRNDRAAQAPPAGTQIFVSNLPRNMLASHLYPYFAVIGEVYEFRLMMEFSGFSRGFCFVTFMHVEHADQAVRVLHGYILIDRALCVYKSWDNTKLFIYGIPTTVTALQLREELRHRFEGIVDVQCKADAHRGQANRGWAFIEFESHRAASLCRKSMWPNKLRLWGSCITVEWARPDRSLEARNNCSIKLQNLPVGMSKNDVYELVRTRLKTPALLQIYKKIGIDQATLEFNSLHSVYAAIKYLTGLTHNGCTISVSRVGTTSRSESLTAIEAAAAAVANMKLDNPVASTVYAKPSYPIATNSRIANDKNAKDLNIASSGQATYHARIDDILLLNMPFGTEIINPSSNYAFDDAYHDLFPDDPTFKPTDVYGTGLNTVKKDDF